MRISKMNNHLVLIFLLLFLQLKCQLVSSQTQILSLYDSEISSSSFGEPVFRLEPPNVIKFANTRGTTIVCLASGKQKPTITWYSGSKSQEQTSLSSTNDIDDTNRPIGNITNLRLITQNGAALHLLPFKESDYRQDVHSTNYRCAATNHLATIHSRSVQVQASVASQQLAQDIVKLADEFVALSSPAVLRCRLDPSGWFNLPAQNPEDRSSLQWQDQQQQHQQQQQQQQQLTFEWFTGEGVQVASSGEWQIKGNGKKFTALASGELHISNVDMTDLQRTYACRLRSSQDRRLVASSNFAQLILMDANSKTPDEKQISIQSKSNRQPIVLHSVSQMVTWDHNGYDQRSNQQVNWNLPSQQHSDWRLGASGDVSLLILPCALRNPTKGRWMYEAPVQSGIPGKPVPLSQMAAARSIQMASVDSVHSNGTKSEIHRRTRLIERSQMKLQTSKFLIGATYLAIEWPKRSLSGRYFYQTEVFDSELREPTTNTICDINVIISHPIKLKMRPNLSISESQSQRHQRHVSSESLRATDWSGSTLFRWLMNTKTEDKKRTPRHINIQDDRDQINLPTMRNPQIELDAKRIQVSGTGVILEPPIAQVGQRLQLDCLGSGYPIEGIRWFKNGQMINTQSAQDFQVEISGRDNFESELDIEEEPSERLLSSLLIRQVQPRDFGPQMFECFAFNSMGEESRVGQLVFVADQRLLSWARAQCPLDQMQESNLTSLADESQAFKWLQVSGNSNERVQALAFKLQNPIQQSHIIEAEPVELRCPAASRRQPDGQQPRVEWRRIANEGAKNSNGQANQLFTGDSRFLINGSSLLMRSSSKRHDESVYFCRIQWNSDSRQEEVAFKAEDLASESLGADANPLAAGHSSGWWSNHQSSSSYCNQRLVAAGFYAQDQDAASSTNSLLQMSSINIRIVAKLKLDPFEFSRNLEEGMRAVVVCAVISGEPPVSITWFKDGEYLTLDEQISVTHANDFSSSLTFHKIQPSHSGLYTCVAANAFSSTNHTSRLLVNVAPYFIDPPKSSKGILGSNLVVDCRAGGQPSPQIRWRKLVAVDGSGQVVPMPAQGSAVSLAKVGQSAPVKLSNKQLDFSAQDSNSLELTQVAPFETPNDSSQWRYEFRIVTSNSHIQILENGSMIIKELELMDSSRYACQAFNGINPSLSELIDVQVLSPPQFDVDLETVSMKRDSMVKFNCAPRGDQPMRIEWFKENNRLVVRNSSAFDPMRHQQSKYSQVAYLAANGISTNANTSDYPKQRHSDLVLGLPIGDAEANATREISSETPIKSSELFINYADRSDTGTFVCLATNPFGSDQITYRLIVQDTPDSPMNLNVPSVDTNSIKLLWTIPFDGNLPLTHYIIEYRKLSSAATKRSQLEGRPSQSEWSRLVVDTSKLIPAENLNLRLPIRGGAHNGANQQQVGLVLHQLAARSSYHIRVAAMNAIGQGAFSSILSVSTAEEPPRARPIDLRVQSLSSSSMKVIWRGPVISDEQAPIRGYYISHRRTQPFEGTAQVDQQQSPWLATVSISSTNGTSYSNDAMGSFSESNQKQANSRQSLASLGGQNYEILINNLDKNSKYDIRVQPFNSKGVGPSADIIGQTLKFDRPNQPNLKLVATRRQSLELKWTISDSEPLMGFSLYFKSESDDWQEIQLAIIYHYVIENLRCGNKYQIYLSAFNSVGRSDPSDVLSVRTEGSSPIAPDKSRFFKANITEVTLEMSNWQSGGCSITNFLIQFARLHDSNWMVLSEGSTPFANSDRITIPDLQAATWYKLLVSARNEAGTTDAEYLFSTLDPNGQPIEPDYPIDQEMYGQHRVNSTGRSSVLNSINQLLFSANANGQNDSQLLLPMSCILLLIVTSLASYLYYSRGPSHSQNRPTRQQTKHGSHSSQFQTRNSNDRSPSLHGNLNTHGHQTTNSIPCGGDTLTRTSLLLTGDDKRFVNQSNTMHLLHQLHKSLPFDSNQCDANSTDLHSFGNSNHSTRGQIFLKATQNGLPPTGSYANSSSLSTHSTNCQADSSSSQASSSGASGTSRQLQTKLQLIDESSMIEQVQQYQCDQNESQQSSHMSPGRAFYAPKSEHVDIIAGDGDLLEQNLASLLGDQNRHLASSSSFASATDLIQRQQLYYRKQLERTGEPIYQRLESFQNCGLSNCAKQGQYSTMNPAMKSQTLRFINSQFSPRDNQSNEQLISMTLHRHPTTNQVKVNSNCNVNFVDQQLVGAQMSAPDGYTQDLNSFHQIHGDFSPGDQANASEQTNYNNQNYL